MFPTDRWKWSTQDGAKHTPKESFVLPPNWKWENEWMIDSMVPGDEEVIMRCWGGGGGACVPTILPISVTGMSDSAK